MTESELAEILKRNPEVSLAGGFHADNTAPRVASISVRVPTEAEEQIALFAWINANTSRHPALAFAHHSPNGEFRFPATAGRLKAMGVRAGFPDVLMVWNHNRDRRCGMNYVGLAIELKRSDRSNHATNEQVIWLEYLAAQGFRCEICYGAQAAIGIICEYLQIEAEGSDDSI